MAVARREEAEKTTAPRLLINEIFHSLQGESATVGIPTVFIRLTGCPLRCLYCDTEYAFTGGSWMYLDEIQEKVRASNAGYVTVTGGEPLAQKTCLDLLTRLCDDGYRVSLETSGAIDVSGVDKRVVKVVDIKTPASGESAKNLFENFTHLVPHDQIKFVICSRNDYKWAHEILDKYKLYEICEVLFSPSHEQLEPRLLADWILQDHLRVRLQIQLHKYLWGNVPGH